MDNQRLLYLLNEYTHNCITTEDFEELSVYMHQPDADAIVLEAMKQIGKDQSINEIPSKDKLRIYGELTARPEFTNTKKTPTVKRLWFNYGIKISAAALALILVGVPIYLYRIDTVNQNELSELNKNSLNNTSKKVSLTLADGTEMLLDTNKTGILAHQGIHVVSQQGGVLSYEDSKSTKQGTSDYNTITVPKGATYQLLLADGTKVWINASSSLRFPIAFNGKTREVQIQGEAYFEVTHKAENPFIVRSGATAVTVLGTHFNVNAYPGEDMVTTLLSGAVKVDRDNRFAILKPNQKAIVKEGEQLIKVLDVDAQEAIDWQKGYFVFHNENIKEVMRTVSRWYDVEVSYQGDMSNITIGGTISKFENLEKLLKSLEMTGTVHFKIKERSVIVMP